MSTNDEVNRANDEGLNADATTQSDLWASDDERHDDGFRRDQFGNRLDDDGNRVDPEGRPMDVDGDPVDESGQRVDDEGQPLDENDDDGVIPQVIPPLPPMMGR